MLSRSFQAIRHCSYHQPLRECSLRTLQPIARRLYTTETTEEKEQEQKPFREPPVVLGLREPPIVDKSGWLERKSRKLKDLTDYDKAFAAHAANRRYLVEEATRSYYADIHEMRKHGGKMYEASDKLIKAEKAGYMPDFEGMDLLKQHVHTTDLLTGKITLMSFVYAQYGESHVKSFIEPFMHHFAQKKDVQQLYLNVQENFMKQWILRAFVPSIRKSVPEEQRDKYILLLKDLTRVRRRLDMTNQYIGYVYLVDEKCRIRWTAHGNATEKEISNMLGMTEYLIQKRQ